jgi:hypothetical protein
MRWDRVAITDCGKAAIASVLTALQDTEQRTRIRRPADQDRLNGTLEAILLDLYAAAKADPSRFLAYSRNSNDFDHGRYGNPLVTLTAVRTVTDYLTKAGLTEGAPGYYDRTPNAFGGPGGHGRRTRVRATPRLITLLEASGLSIDGIGQRPTTEIIRLKGPPAGRGATKPRLEYDDTDETFAMRQSLAELNALIASTRIDLDSQDPIEPAEDLGEIEADDRPDAKDRTARQLYRVFNNGSLEQGGRFYGGWWQALRKADRQRLLIDGEPTVELDFKSMHTRLCYQFEGCPLPPDVDPYLIPGLPKTSRDVVKAALNRLINAAPGKTPRAPERAVAGLPPGMTWKRLLETVEAHHAPIAPWFRSGQGMRLQFVDSAIADAVLRYLTFRRVPCLPVHDSFIVAESHERQLGETMFLAYYAQSGKHGATKAYPVISGWSSLTVEALIRARLEG